MPSLRSLCLSIFRRLFRRHQDKLRQEFLDAMFKHHQKYCPYGDEHLDALVRQRHSVLADMMDLPTQYIAHSRYAAHMRVRHHIFNVWFLLFVGAWVYQMVELTYYHLTLPPMLPIAMDIISWAFMLYCILALWLYTTLHHWRMRRLQRRETLLRQRYHDLLDQAEAYAEEAGVRFAWADVPDSPFVAGAEEV